MAKSSTFNVSLKLLTQQFNKGIKDIQKQIRGVGNFIKSAFAVGSITAFGKQMIQTAMDFEDAMARVQAVSNASSANLKMMSDEAKRLGATTRYTATEAAGALENLTRNGMSASQATKALSGVLQLAQANSVGLAEAADIVSNTMNMFGLSVKDVTRINDVLSATASTTATNITEIYAALVNAAPAAKVLGFSLEETTAAIGALAQRGVKAEQAGTALRMAFTKMVDPKIVAKMQGMGVAIDEQVMKEEGLLGTVKRLKDANLSMSQAVEIFSQRGAVGIQQLIGVYDELEIQMKIAEDAAGTTQRMFEQGVGSTRQAVDTLKSSYEAFLESMGSKSSGVFNSVVKGLTNLIRNFNNVQGTIANIATLSLPLMIKGFRSAGTAIAAAGGKIVGVFKAIKTAMGGWVGLAVTAVTLIGTHLVTAWNKHNAAVKEAQKGLGDAEHEISDMRIAVTNLITKLDKDGENSLNSVVKTATQLFPEFAEAIRRAAAEADKTDGYTRLKNTLREIVELQSLVISQASQQKMYDAYLDQGAQLMLQNGTEMGLKPLLDYMKKNKWSDELKTTVLRELLDIRARQGVDLTQKKQLENNFVMQKTNGALTSIDFNSSRGGLPPIIGQLRSTNDTMEDMASKVDKLNYTIERESLEREAGNYPNLKGKWNSETSNDELRKMIDKEKERIAKAVSDALSEDEKKKNAADRLVKIDEDFNNAIANAEDDLKNGYIDFAEYTKKLAEAARQAYEKFRDETGKRGSDNKYKELRDAYGRRAKDYEEGKGLRDAMTKYGGLKENGGLLKDKQGLAGPTGTPDATFLNNITVIKEWNTLFGQSVNIADTFAYSLQSIENAWDRLDSASASPLEKFSAAIQILQSLRSAGQGLAEMWEMLGMKELVAAKINDWATKKKMSNDKKSILGDTAAAVVGAIKSVVSIPYVGPILAVGAVAGILGLIAASAPKFASGGIITGGSNHGDRNIARVNAGEMILNKNQQKRLFDIANGAGVGGSKIIAETYVAGKDLKLVLRNVDAANYRISGAKGL